MTELINVRTAVAEDERGLMQIALLLHEENGLFGLTPERIRTVLQRAWNKDRIIIGVVGPIGEPVACVGLYLNECWYSGEESLEELFNFVHPDFRRSSYAKELLEFAKRVSDELAIPLTIGVISTDRMEPKVRLYRRRFGEPAGMFFIYNKHLIQGHA